MKEVSLFKDTYMKAKIMCRKLEFPMKFFCHNQSANLTIMVSYDSVPSSNYYHEKYFTNKFFLTGGLDPDNVSYVAIMIVSHSTINTRIGCAFKGLKQQFDPFRRKIKSPSFDISNKRKLVNHGIDYDSFIDFKLDISSSRINGWSEIPQDIVRKNVKEVRSLKVGDWSKKKYEKMMEKFLDRRVKTAEANRRRDFNERRRVFILRNGKSRNQRCKERREYETRVAIEYFQQFAILSSWVHFVKKIKVIQGIWDMLVERKRIIGSLKKCDFVSRFFGKCYPRIKRGKRSATMGGLRRTKR